MPPINVNKKLTTSLAITASTLNQFTNAGELEAVPVTLAKGRQFGRTFQKSVRTPITDQASAIAHRAVSLVRLVFLVQRNVTLYRNYAEPDFSTIYREFSSPTWPFTASGTISIVSHENQQSQLSTLQPATPYRWNHVELTLVSTATPISQSLQLFHN